MTAPNVKAIDVGREAAQSQSVTIWTLFGFFPPLIGIVVVYIRSPPMPITLLAAYGDDDTRH